jgi:hypothetical protein
MLVRALWRVRSGFVIGNAPGTEPDRAAGAPLRARRDRGGAHALLAARRSPARPHS